MGGGGGDRLWGGGARGEGGVRLEERGWGGGGMHMMGTKLTDTTIDSN